MRFRNPLGAGFSDKYHVSPMSILGHCVDVVSLSKALHPQTIQLTQWENAYLVRQRWQCVRLVKCAEIAAGLYAHRGVEMAHVCSVPVAMR